MIIEIGPRTIGKCHFKFHNCTAKALNIVKKVLVAKDGEQVWTCHQCMVEKVKIDREYYLKNLKNIRETL